MKVLACFNTLTSSALVSLLLVSALSGCNSSDTHLLNQLHQQLAPLETMTTGYKVLNLDSLTDFAWDRVYFFSGNAKPEYISRKIGFSWNGPEVYHTDRRLLFVKEKEVVAYVDCSRALVRSPDQPFLPISMYECSDNEPLGIPRKQAKFAAFRSCEGAFINYELAPLSCLNSFRASIAKGCKDFIDRKTYDRHAVDSARRAFIQQAAKEMYPKESQK